MPEKIAHKRHHPQRDAIQTLCLLSLVFGGMLWPIAWLWAYTKPAGYRLAYGTEKHEDYFHEMGDKARAGELLEHELAHLREELDAMAVKGTLSPKLRVLRHYRAQTAPTRPRPRCRGPDEILPPSTACLADLHQVQVAAVEYGVAGHGRHHSHRRAGGTDPDAQHRGAVDA
jgi:hypothetical protein